MARLYYIHNITPINWETFVLIGGLNREARDPKVSDIQVDGDDIIMNNRSRSGKAQLAIQQLPSFWKELNIHRRKDGNQCLAQANQMGDSSCEAGLPVLPVIGL